MEWKREFWEEWEGEEIKNEGIFWRFFEDLFSIGMELFFRELGKDVKVFIENKRER